MERSDDEHHLSGGSRQLRLPGAWRPAAWVAVVLRLFGTASLACCASAGFDAGSLEDLQVLGFQSDDVEHCRPSDVNLDHRASRGFFLRAAQVTTRTLHDHHDHAPCHIAGTLKHRLSVCSWEIRAGATGHIRCGTETWYFACDSCEDLFMAP